MLGIIIAQFLIICPQTPWAVHQLPGPEEFNEELSERLDLFGIGAKSKEVAACLVKVMRTQTRELENARIRLQANKRNVLQRTPNEYIA